MIEIRNATAEDLIASSAVLAAHHLAQIPHNEQEMELQKIVARFSALPTLRELPDDIVTQMTAAFIERTLALVFEHGPAAGEA